MTRLIKRLIANRRARLGILLVGLLAVAAVLSPILVEHDPAEQLGLAMQQHPPSAAHPLGTDLVGRDLLSRVLAGIRLSLAIASISVLISVTVGTGVGLVSGYSGGMVDAVLMRSVDAALAVPRVLLLLVVLVIFPIGVPSLVAVWASPAGLALAGSCVPRS